MSGGHWIVGGWVSATATCSVATVEHPPTVTTSLSVNGPRPQVWSPVGKSLNQ